MVESFVLCYVIPPILSFFAGGYFAQWIRQGSPRYFVLSLVCLAGSLITLFVGVSRLDGWCW